MNALDREPTMAEADELIRNLCVQSAALESVAVEAAAEAEVYLSMAVEGIHVLADAFAQRRRDEGTMDRQRDEIRTLRAELQRYTGRATDEAA